LDGLLLKFLKKGLDVRKGAGLARRGVERIVDLGHVLPGHRQHLLQPPQGLLHLLGRDIWGGGKGVGGKERDTYI